MVKKPLLSLSVAAMMMTGAIAYGQQSVQAAPQAATNMVDVDETVSEDAGIEVIEQSRYETSNNLRFGDLLYYVNNDKTTVTIAGLAEPDKSSNINVTIPAVIDNMTVTNIADSAFRNNANIKSVVLNEGLVAVGQAAFEGCVNIVGTLTIPSTVTTIKGSNYDWQENGGAFQNTSISEVKIEDGNTALELGINTFRGCRSLQKVTLSNRINTIGAYCFMGDMSLGTVNYSAAGQALVIGKGAFQETILTSVILPDTVTEVGESAFKDCKSLTKVVMGNKVTKIGTSAFCGDTGLTSVTFNEGLLTIGSGAFESCTNLAAKIVIPSTVTAINGARYDWEDKGGAFQNSGITEVEFKASNAALDLGINTFRDCARLEKVSLPARLKTIGANCFLKDSSLKTVSLVDGNNSLKIGDASFSSTAVKQLVLPANTVSVGQSAFADCASLESVTLNEGLTTIGSAAFINCKSLSCEVVIPSTVTSIGGGAYSWNTDGAFQNTGIWSVTIKDGNAGIDIGGNAFKGCTNLRFAELSNRVKSIGTQAFANDIRLAWVRMSNGVYEASIGEEAFMNDTYIKAVVIPRMSKVGNQVAAGCTKLKDIYYASTTTDYGNYVSVTSDNDVYRAATIHYESQGPAPMPAITYTGWETIGEQKFWYENDLLQGYDPNNKEYRGKEIYDEDSNAWYWLDSVQGGTMAVSKDVYQESAAGQYADREDGTGKWVRYDKNGHMVKGFDTNENGTYYFDSIYGAMVKGLQNINGVLYYFDQYTGVMQTGAVNINGIEYGFDSEGKAVNSAWLAIDGKQYWYENGVRQGMEGRGKEIFDAKLDAWFWLDAVQGGAKATSKDVYQESSGGKWVRYDSYGRMIKGWSYVSWGKYNYFDLNTGAMYKGWHNINGTDYYFDENTGLTIR